jgi:hypothetical protein
MMESLHPEPDPLQAHDSNRGVLFSSSVRRAPLSCGLIFALRSGCRTSKICALWCSSEDAKFQKPC